MITYPRTIKLIVTKRFEVALHQLEDGMYVIKSKTVDKEYFDYSEDTRYFNTASFLFDLKLADLEGH